MQFIADGPDIPDELITAQEKGDVVFICGAGVSMRLGLPSFGGLVEGIYAALHESWQGHPAESEGMEPTGVFYRQYDRVLRQLEKRLEASDAPRNRGMRERFRTAIRAALVSPEHPDLSSHLDLIELSRDEEGTKRLLTTNFDTLFERAWANVRKTKLPSHAGVSMPQPRVAGFAGIMHLHGRLADAHLGLNETDLVVTSAEFGDAYIRSGWASRYVYDLARTQTIVLVGYSADDPPVRYLLETLEADRTRYPDLHEVYAFGSCEVGQETLEMARWKAKGVTTPILYYAPGLDHSRLYESLSAWRQYAADPTAWRRGKLKALFERDFSSLTAAEIGSAAALLRHGDASALLGELSPDPRWIEEFAGKNIFKRDKTHPGRWFASRIDDPEMIRAASRIGPFDDPTRWFVRAAIREHKKLSPLRRHAWEALASPSRGWSPEDRDDDWFRILPRLKEGDTGYETRSVVARILTPRFHIERPYRLADEREAEERLGQLLQIDFKSAEYPSPEEVTQAWPDDKDGIVDLLAMLDRRLRDSLEQAEDVGFLASYDRSNSDVPSVAAHAQNRYGSGFYPIIRVMADLWSKLAAHDAPAARTLALAYLRSEYRLQHRLGLFALHDAAAFSADVAGSALLALSDERFWDRSEQVELMRLLTGRWSEFPGKHRDQLEERLRLGPPREIYPGGSFQSKGDWEAVSDRAIQDRLLRLKAAGTTLAAESEAVLAAISERRPGWKSDGGDREDFAAWSESGSGPNGHPELLSGIGDDKLVAEAMRLQRERYFEEGDIWRLIANADSHRALRALAVEAAGRAWNVHAWRTMFTVAENSSDATLQEAFAGAVAGMPNGPLGEVLSNASSWLRTKWSLLPAEGASSALALWDRLAGLAYNPELPEESPSGDGEQLINEALNRPGGVLAWALLEALNSHKPEASSGLPESLRPRFDRLIAAAGRPGLLARIMLAETLSWLHHVDAEWAQTNIVPRLMWSHGEAPYLWHAHARGNAPKDASLFNALRDAQLDAFDHRQLRDDDLAALSHRLVEVGIWHRYGNSFDMVLNDAAIKHALTVGPSASRKDASFTFWKIMGNVSFDEIGQLRRWRETIGPYFSAVYPLDAALRSPATSRDLSHMALDSGEAFSEVVDAIRDLLVPYELYNLAHSLRFESKHSDLVNTQPLAFLRLASALIDPKVFPVPPDLQTLLNDARTALPSVVEEPEYIRLSGLAKLGNA